MIPFITKLYIAGIFLMLTLELINEFSGRIEIKKMKLRYSRQSHWFRNILVLSLSSWLGVLLFILEAIGLLKIFDDHGVMGRHNINKNNHIDIKYFRDRNLSGRE